MNSSANGRQGVTMPEEDLSTLSTPALFYRHLEISRIKVLGNTLLYGPETGTAAAASVAVERDPDRRRLIQLGLDAVVMELQRVEAELRRRPDGLELIFSSISERRRADGDQDEQRGAGRSIVSTSIGPVDVATLDLARLKDLQRRWRKYHAELNSQINQLEALKRGDGQGDYDAKQSEELGKQLAELEGDLARVEAEILQRPPGHRMRH